MSKVRNYAEESAKAATMEATQNEKKADKKNSNILSSIASVAEAVGHKKNSKENKESEKVMSPEEVAKRVAELTADLIKVSVELKTENEENKRIIESGAKVSDTERQESINRCLKAATAKKKIENELKNLGVDPATILNESSDEKEEAKEENTTEKGFDPSNLTENSKSFNEVKMEAHDPEILNSEKELEEELDKEEAEEAKKFNPKVVAQDLKRTIVDAKNKIEYNHLGLSNMEQFTFYPDGKVSVLIDTKGGLRDPKVVKEYLDSLMSGKFSASPYWDDKDNFYSLAEKFYTLPFGSKEREAILIKMIGHFNTMRRQCTWTDEQYKNRHDFAAEKVLRKQVKKSYTTGNPMKVPGDNWNRNVLKEVAWAVVHAYLVDVFMYEKDMLDLVPVENKEVEALWNNYIGMMDDVPSDLKQYFMINNGNCIFVETASKHLCTTPNRTADGDFPRDDVPFESAVVSNEELDRQFKAAIERDDYADEVKAKKEKKSTAEKAFETKKVSTAEKAFENKKASTAKKSTTKKKEYTFGELKAGTESGEAENFQKGQDLKK